ncbi:MAG: stage 0 sporulation protein [Bacilli bacterium]|nr:stage 0 sporulation protein [Bacilli bacterium]
METKEYYVGVKFQGSIKAYYFSTTIEDLKIDDLVVVETVAGFEIGSICTDIIPISKYTGTLALKPVIRRPNPSDMAAYELGKREAKEALEITKREVEALNLPMNLLDAYYTLDGTKVTITYTSENRVDFRELLRILAPQLKCRIELHQIAARDKAKMIGGIGICGLTLCCSTFLNQFDGISISRAKNQMLTLNIPKLSGHCGKLICCLLFEDDMYTEAKKDFPAIGYITKIDGVDYKVDGLNILSRTVKLVSEGDVKFISLEEYRALEKKNPRPFRKNNNKHDKQGA